MKIQEGKIRIATADRCVMCGEIIPEGQQVCGLCKHKTDLEETIACRYYVPAWAGNKTSKARSRKDDKNRGVSVRILHKAQNRHREAY